MAQTLKNEELHLAHSFCSRLRNRCFWNL